MELLARRAGGQHYPFPRDKEVREQLLCHWKLSYWIQFPKKLGGEKHYRMAKLDENICN